MEYVVQRLKDAICSSSDGALAWEIFTKTLPQLSKRS